MVWALLRGQWRTYAIGTIFVAVGIAAALAYPQIIRLMIDQGILGGHLDRINGLGLLMAALLASEAVATLLRNYLFNLAAERMAADLQQRAFEHLLTEDIAFFDSRTTGELTSRLAAAVPSLQRVFGDELADALRNVLWGVGGTVLLFYTSPRLSAIVLLSVPPIVIASALLGRRVKRDTAAMQHAYAECGTIAEEAIGGIRTVRAFVQESAEAARHRRAIAAAEWIVALLGRTPAMPLQGGERPGRMAGHVTFDRVDFSYPARPDVAAVRDVNVRVAPGETIAFVGRSGSGKSTLLALLLRFYDPDRGRILLDGVDLRHIDPSWLRARIGVVLQDPVLFSRSIAANIRYGQPGATDDEVRAAAAIAHVEEFVARLPEGYATPIGDRGVQLSGGQRQRLAIARAVLRRPPVLMLDEATSALDAESESLVQDALRALDYRPTTLIVAHRLSTVVNVDRVIVLDRGRIVAEGSHEYLLQTCEFYRQLVETQLVAA